MIGTSNQILIEKCAVFTAYSRRKNGKDPIIGAFRNITGYEKPDEYLELPTPGIPHRMLVVDGPHEHTQTGKPHRHFTVVPFRHLAEGEDTHFNFLTGPDFCRLRKSARKREKLQDSIFANETVMFDYLWLTQQSVQLLSKKM